MSQVVGYQWLKERYGLNEFTLTHTSYIGSSNSIELTSQGNIEEVYGPKYALAKDTPLSHLEFALKYDDLNLDLLKAIFTHIPPGDIANYISLSPSGKYARKTGFLYEFLTGNVLDLAVTISGNYTDLLEQEKYITGNNIRDARWRINNNLLGNMAFCPIVRKTKIMTALLSRDIPGKIQHLKSSFSPDIFNRATRYLYGKETRSSYEIEREKPSADRVEKFIGLLMKAGTDESSRLFEETRLLELQNAIVDTRFAATQFRDFQNFIGQTLSGYREVLHYICPPPYMLRSVMDGLKEVAAKTAGIYPEVRAAILSFGFVFIHPFEDGNGRLHRFIIHDVLAHDGVVPHGLVIPVSAHMLNNMGQYDSILEKYSKPLMQRIRYKSDEAGEVAVTNPGAVEGYYRYPDLTDHCVYLMQVIHATLDQDIPGELIFLQRYDEVKRSLQDIVDMPDKEIDRMITFLHQNKGVFPKKRREYFSRLTDTEIAAMQRKFRDIFDMDVQAN